MRHDPAFLWETEAMRETTDRRSVAAPPRRDESRSEPGFTTLRDANEVTGIPVDTLRKWARRGAIPSYVDARHNLRMVSMEGVIARAAELGRDITIRPDVATAGPPASHPGPTRTAVSAPPVESPVGRSAPPDRTGETMIVPIAAWDKMLMQLGNLHEAGQQLAEARERAAKAETEARFLRERLVELRGELTEARATTVGADAVPQSSPADAEKTGEVRPQPLWRYVYQGWRGRRRR
jgi:hypothetical protein